MNPVGKILDKFGARVSKQAKINVGSSKNPNGGKKIDSTGALRKSIGYDLKDTETGFSLTFKMEDYGELRDSGQLGSKKKILKGFNKSLFKRGKGFTNKPPKVSALNKWIKDKPIKARDKNGAFISRFFTISRGKRKGEQGDRLDTVSYLIGQKIKKEGIQPGLFFSAAWDKEFKDMPDDIAQGFADSIEGLLE